MFHSWNQFPSICKFSKNFRSRLKSRKCIIKKTSHRNPPALRESNNFAYLYQKYCDLFETKSLTNLYCFIALILYGWQSVKYWIWWYAAPWIWEQSIHKMILFTSCTRWHYYKLFAADQRTETPNLAQMSTGWNSAKFLQKYIQKHI